MVLWLSLRRHRSTQLAEGDIVHAQHFSGPWHWIMSKEAYRLLPTNLLQLMNFRHHLEVVARKARLPNVCRCRTLISNIKCSSNIIELAESQRTLLLDWAQEPTFKRNLWLSLLCTWALRSVCDGKGRNDILLFVNNLIFTPFTLWVVALPLSHICTWDTGLSLRWHWIWHQVLFSNTFFS